MKYGIPNFYSINLMPEDLIPTFPPFNFNLIYNDSVHCHIILTEWNIPPVCMSPKATLPGCHYSLSLSENSIMTSKDYFVRGYFPSVKLDGGWWKYWIKYSVQLTTLRVYRGRWVVCMHVKTEEMIVVLNVSCLEWNKFWFHCGKNPVSLRTHHNTKRVTGNQDLVQFFQYWPSQTKVRKKNRKLEPEKSKVRM